MELDVVRAVVRDDLPPLLVPFYTAVLHGDAPLVIAAPAPAMVVNQVVF